MTSLKKLFSFSQNEISFVFNNAKAIASIKGLKLLACTGRYQEFPLDHGKMLIITPRKVGKAHDRNKIRRQIKAIFYNKQLHKNKIRTVLLVYPNALDLSFKEVELFLINSFKRIKS